MDKAMAKYIFPTLMTAICMSLLSGCITQSFENNEPIVKTQANRDEMAATRVSLGLGYLGMGDMAQAKLNLERAKRFSPNLVQVHTAFAHYYETVGEGKLAIESFEQALTLKADSADTLNNYGVFLCRQGKVAAAEVQFLKAIAVPSYLLVAQSYENLASCYLQNDNFEKAEMYLNKAIYHSPNRTATLLQMVRLQYAMGNYKEGKRFLQKFERNTQRFTANSLALAYKLYWKLGQRRTANNYANMLIKMYPQSWEGKQYLLNELELIDADNLAKKYQLTQKQKNKHLSSSNNKRVVKLSPKKSGYSPYTSSVKTINSPNTAVKSSGSKTALIPTTLPSNATTASKASKATLGTGATLLSATVAGTVAANTGVLAVGSAAGAPTASSVLTSNTLASSTMVSSTMAAKAVEQVAQPVSSIIEPTSTQPIPATRDVPLPEALPEPVEAEVVLAEEATTAKESIKEPVETEVALAEEITTAKESIKEPVNTEVVIAEAVLAEEVINDAENVDSPEVLHTVKPGENLYSISMKYNIKLAALRKWNNISEKNKIRIGKKLYVVDPQTVNKIND